MRISRLRTKLHKNISALLVAGVALGTLTACDINDFAYPDAAQPAPAASSASSVQQPASKPQPAPNSAPNKPAANKPAQNATAQADPAQLTSPLRVVKVVDGDTIKVDLHGTTETVRIIGFDTPETKKPGTPVQPFGPEATANMERLVAGKRVYLEYDPTQGDRDYYGRILAHVWTASPTGPGELVGANQLAKGLAKEYTYKKPYKYQGLYRSVETTAKTQHLGIWG